MCSLTRNYTESCRYPYKILKECKDVLPLELLAQLKRVLHHYSPTKFVGHIVANNSDKPAHAEITPRSQMTFQR